MGERTRPTKASQRESLDTFAEAAGRQPNAALARGYSRSFAVGTTAARSTSGLQPLAGSGRARAVRFVEAITTGSGTNVFDSLEATLKDRRVDTIYLLTDGNPTRGRFTAPAAILKEIGALNRVRGATIHCIAFGAESKLLKDLAAQNGGKYRFVDSY